ncbi:MAG: formylglycine-generating enzyme family protein [Spirulinaceae cyanobacterium SM2_1_0]|nr:formylglycine-generating enzyme family protein [Spirulinaceae cyanobacterium SM2_1_0]
MSGEFVWVAGGAFILGSDRAERDYAYQISAEADAREPAEVAPRLASLRQRRWFEREPERQTRQLPGFCFGRHLVTNADYQAFIQATDHRAPGITADEYQAQGFLVHAYDKVRPYLWQADQYPAGEGDRPVVLVSHDDAIAFAAWRSRQDGVTYRLPTALEWEKAARGTDGRYFPWGDVWRDDATNWAGSGGLATSDSGEYPLSRSPDGAEDMAGNVFEWTATQRQRDTQVRAVLKGCSWDDSPGFCRAAYRHTRPVASRHILFGFRLLRER